MFVIKIIVYICRNKTIMILFISGLILAYVCDHFDKELKQKRRLKKAKKELFSDDRPKYYTK